MRTYYYYYHHDDIMAGTATTTTTTATAVTAGAPTPPAAELPANYSRWVIVYPPYIDAGRTQRGGRRVAKRHAVSEPTVREIAEVCARALRLDVLVEANKGYSRDFFSVGRVRVHLKRVAGDEEEEEAEEGDGGGAGAVVDAARADRPVNPECPSRIALFRRVASELHKQRRQRQQQQQQQQRGAGGGSDKQQRRRRR